MNTILVGEVAQVFNGKTPSKLEQRESGFPVLKIKNVDENGYFRNNIDSFIDVDLASKFKSKVVQEKDILILNAAHNAAYVGSKMCLVNKDMVGNLATGEWTIIRPTAERIIPEFLYFWLNSSAGKGQLKHAVKGIHLYPKDVAKFQVPPLSLEEQKNIVQSLVEFNSIQQKRKQAISLVDEYLKSIFLEMFGDPKINDKRWKKLPIHQLGKVTTGNTPSRKDAQNYGNHIEWIKSDNIPEETPFLTIADEYLSEKGAESGRIIPKGSLLTVCIAGSKKSIGRTAITDRPVSFNQQINAITPYRTTNTYFLYYLLKLGKELIQEKSTSGMKGIVSKGVFEKIELISPPIELQTKFGDQFLSIYKVKEKQIISGRLLEESLQSLMQKSFSYEN